MVRKIRVALVYPNLYKVGGANLGFHIVYALANSLENIQCERFFLDIDKSLETGARLKDFDLILFSWQFELDCLNILEILHRNNIPLRRENRKQVIALGGPCTVNPLPLKKFIDLFFIGEAEANLIPFLKLYSEVGKEFEAFTEIEGIFVSELNNPTKRVYLKNLDEYIPKVEAEDTAFGEAFLLEVSRGCNRGCRFCMAGYTFRPKRERSIEKIYEILGEIRKRKICLLGASVSDYSNIDELCLELCKRNFLISIPSLRADTLSEIMVEALVKSGQRSITLAPEANERLRNIIKKNISDEQFLKACNICFERGIKNFKLYFILGLPTESEDDIKEEVELVRKIKGRKKLSINPLIPKPHTPFQWLAFEEISEIKRRFKLFRKYIKYMQSSVEVEIENLKKAFLQATISRGDEKLGDIIEKAFYYGKGMGAFRRAFKEEGVNFNNYVRAINIDEKLPWDVIDAGVKKEFLKKEYERALSG